MRGEDRRGVFERRKVILFFWGAGVSNRGLVGLKARDRARGEIGDPDESVLRK